MSMFELVHEYLAETSSPVQLVKHLDEVTEKNIKYPLIGQIKYDGIYALLVVCDGEFKFYSRTGKPFYFEYNTLGHGYSRLGRLAEGAYILELCNPEYSLEQLSGLVNTNRKKLWEAVDCEKMRTGVALHFHDFVTLDELLGGHSEQSYEDRQLTLCDNLLKVGLRHNAVGNQWMHSREDAENFANMLIEHGHEGAVFKDYTADWVAGHKGYRSMKLVRGIHLDLLCVGVEYGKGKRAGLIAALRFKMGDNTFLADLGKGWTDERRQAITRSYELTFDPHTTHEDEFNPIGKIWEVKALQMSSTGKAMRLPKVVRVRDDKDFPDDYLG